MDKNEKALRRIAGQVQGIERMYKGKKSCMEIVQQILAAREALGRVGKELLKKEVSRCINDEKESKKLDKVLLQLFKS